jgi:hypothetical protein
VDASGTFNKSVRDAALMRMSQAGAVMINWFALACELARDWRNDMEGLAGLLGAHLPAYQNLITSYNALTATKSDGVVRRPGDIPNRSKVCSAMRKGEKRGQEP